jgi:spore maturation protein CgeB
MAKKDKEFSIVFIDEYYGGFLNSFYKSHPEWEGLSYEEHLKLLLSQCFGTSDFYSYNLKKLGYSAVDLIVNDEKLQRKWAKEQGIKVGKASVFSRVQTLPILHRFTGRSRWIQEIALAQIKSLKPDVVYVQNLSILNADTLKKIKGQTRLLVGQIATSLPAKKNVRAFDLILTSFPHYVDRFKKMGVKSEYLKISFEKRVWEEIGLKKRIYDVVFIGSFSPHHRDGTKLLEQVARKVPVHIWGQGMQFLSPKSPLRKNFHGEAWGLQMYQILGQSKIVLNRHISVAENYANNMRLYESTGMGAMLITDMKDNLNELFLIDKEVVAYKNVSDLIRQIKYYLKNSAQRQSIARLGQMRTLKAHTYSQRMRELVNILERHLDEKG